MGKYEEAQAKLIKIQEEHIRLLNNIRKLDEAIMKKQEEIINLQKK